MSEATPSPDHHAAIAIVCGGGQFPLAVADAATRRGRRVFLFPIRGWADPELVKRYPHQWLALGQLGVALRRMREEHCHEVVIIGTVLRPSVTQLRLDLTTLRLLPRIVRLFRGGDDHLLSGVNRILEDHGLRIVGAHEVAPEILVPEGTLGQRQPTEAERADITRGLDVIAAMSPFDVGQAVVVAKNHVLAVEAAEGTDHMLARIAEMRRAGRVRVANGIGVLVKAPKRGQDRRVDLPSLGERTVDAVKAAGLAGIAVEADGAITADLSTLIRKANEAGLFLVGVPHPPGDREQRPPSQP